MLSLKNEQEKLFQQEELKSLEMNRLYDKIKVELKRNMEYEHELQLEAKFLAKQVAIAKKKAEILDQELREIQQPNLLASTQPLFQPFLLPKLTSPKPLMVTVESEEPDGLFQKRVKNKIETMK